MEILSLISTRSCGQIIYNVRRESLTPTEQIKVDAISVMSPVHFRKGCSDHPHSLEVMDFN